MGPGPEPVLFLTSICLNGRRFVLVPGAGVKSAQRGRGRPRGTFLLRGGGGSVLARNLLPDRPARDLRGAATPSPPPPHRGRCGGGAAQPPPHRRRPSSATGVRRAGWIGGILVRARTWRGGKGNLSA